MPLQTGRAEYGNALYDQRHRAVISGFYIAPFGIHVGGIASLASGLPYNLTTGVTNSGDTAGYHGPPRHQRCRRRPQHRPRHPGLLP